jgi:uncharacterized protein
MSKPLMPKATAVWLIDNTMLTFDQVAAFCELHPLEVQAIADGDVGAGINGVDPISNGTLSKEEIERCEKDPATRLNMLRRDLPKPATRPKGPRYTPVAKRGEKPDGIAWLVKFHPELNDSQIGRLIGTTKPTITAVRDRTHWNTQTIKPRNPVLLGLCTQADLDKEVIKSGGKTDAEAPPEDKIDNYVEDVPMDY